MLKNLAKNYFKLFSNKNIELIAEMFSEEISLNDPNLSIIGKKEVVNATQNIFNNAEKLHVEIKNLYQDNRVVIAELEIYLNKNMIKIVDIIKFDKSDKIISIRAYKM